MIVLNFVELLQKSVYYADYDVAVVAVEDDVVGGDQDVEEEEVDLNHHPEVEAMEINYTEFNS